MPINKATMLKAQKQQKALRYENKIRDLVSYKPPQMYDVYQGETVVARVPLEQCTRYVGHKLVPVSQQEQFATSA